MNECSSHQDEEIQSHKTEAKEKDRALPAELGVTTECGEMLLLNSSKLSLKNVDLMNRSNEERETDFLVRI